MPLKILNQQATMMVRYLISGWSTYSFIRLLTLLLFHSPDDDDGEGDEDDDEFDDDGGDDDDEDEDEDEDAPSGKKQRTE